MPARAVRRRFRRAVCRSVHTPPAYMCPTRRLCTPMSFFRPQSVNLAWECGDFILRRADGAWAYQLAVVVDDALMGVRQVVRGADLLLSAAQQIYLYRMCWGSSHLPSPISRLFATPKNVACQKRDAALGMAELRAANSPEELLGRIAAMAGLIPEARAISLGELLSEFSWSQNPPPPHSQGIKFKPCPCHPRAFCAFFGKFDCGFLEYFGHRFNGSGEDDVFVELSKIRDSKGWQAVH